MDQALHADETVLVPVIMDFMQRCRVSQEHAAVPEHSQRLSGYLNYWEAFLKALNQSD
jgi:hypothetical protein